MRLFRRLPRLWGGSGGTVHAGFREAGLRREGGAPTRPLLARRHRTRTGSRCVKHGENVSRARGRAMFHVKHCTMIDRDGEPW